MNRLDSTDHLESIKGLSRTDIEDYLIVFSRMYSFHIESRAKDIPLSPLQNFEISRALWAKVASPRKILQLLLLPEKEWISKIRPIVLQIHEIFKLLG